MTWLPVRRLAEKLKPDAGGAVLRKGAVVSYSAGRATVTVGGDTTPIPNVPCATTVAAADNVLLLQQPPLLVVLCKLT